MDSPASALSLSAAQRDTLTRLADALIPSDESFPSASEADPNGRFLDRAMPLIPRQSAMVLALLDKIDASDPQAALARLEQEDPETFWALINLVFGTYLTNRKIWKRMGYPGRRPNPPYEDESDYYLADDLLGPVLSRGPFFRPTPGL